jgi:ParB family transcriptional regulator, chromosome partitioning protein
VYRTPPAAARSDEWYTPPWILERARAVMGGIDLDPASCPRAQRVVQARCMFFKGDGALTHPWGGRVWLNPPYSSPRLEHFIRKLLAEVRARRVRDALVLVPNSTDLPWCQELLAEADVCWLRRRVAFWHRDPSTPLRGNPRGSIVAHLGDDVDRFEDVFGDLGVVSIPVRSYRSELAA